MRPFREVLMDSAVLNVLARFDETAPSPADEKEARKQAAEDAARSERRRIHKARRRAHKTALIAWAKASGYRPNRRVTKCKKSGTNLKALPGRPTPHL